MSFVQSLPASLVRFGYVAGAPTIIYASDRATGVERLVLERKLRDNAYGIERLSITRISKDWAIGSEISRLKISELKVGVDESVGLEYARRIVFDWAVSTEQYVLQKKIALGWLYRKSHVIHSASGAGTNYPIRIVAHFGSGTDSGEDVYLNGHCRSDFGDIRFTGADGETPLDYWMEKKVDGNYAIFWVEIPDDLSISDATIYIYYGNSTATRSDQPQNIDLWSLREHQTSVDYYPNFLFSKPTSSVLRIDSYTAGAGSLGHGYAFIIIPRSFLHGKKITIRWNLYFSNPIDPRDLMLLRAGVFDTELHRAQTLAIKPIEDIFTNVYVTHYPAPLGVGGSARWLGWRIDSSGILDLSSFSSNYVTLLIRLGDAWIGQTVMGDIDYLQIKDQNNNVLIEYHFNESVLMERTGTYEDYGLYRKYVEPEPSHGDWGSEEYLGIEKYAFDQAIGTEQYTIRKSLWKYMSDQATLTERYVIGKKVGVRDVALDLIAVTDLIMPEHHNSEVEALTRIVELLRRIDP